jgi:hypothetical protein
MRWSADRRRGCDLTLKECVCSDQLAHKLAAGQQDRELGREVDGKLVSTSAIAVTRRHLVEAWR